jgi:acetoin:2,6-dichlorophenolindophenol oxidoreductase subunit beta
MRKLHYGEAIREAIQNEMELDPNIILFGLDVTDHKGILGTTLNLVDKFGKERCFSTPLSEDAMTGFALGAAISGLKPIHVHTRADFLVLAANQIINMVSSFKYMVGGKTTIPLLIRAIIGRGWGQSFHHSKSLFSLFGHIPGLTVIAPTTPKDAKGMITAALRSNKPVICYEHRWLYYIDDEVPVSDYEVPLGEPSIMKEGEDITILSTSWMNVEALRAASILEKHDIDVEVIDARTISPLNYELIEKSVKKTGRFIVADHDWIPFGFSSEASANIYHKCFKQLAIPIERIGYAFTPCPTTRPLENIFYPNSTTIVRTIEKMFTIKEIDLSNEVYYSYENKFKGPF